MSRRITFWAAEIEKFLLQQEYTFVYRQMWEAPGVSKTASTTFKIFIFIYSPNHDVLFHLLINYLKSTLPCICFAIIFKIFSEKFPIFKLLLLLGCYTFWIPKVCCKSVENKFTTLPKNIFQCADQVTLWHHIYSLYICIQLRSPNVLKSQTIFPTRLHQLLNISKIRPIRTLPSHYCWKVEG